MITCLLWLESIRQETWGKAKRDRDGLLCIFQSTTQKNTDCTYLWKKTKIESMSILGDCLRNKNSNTYVMIICFFRTLE